MQKVQLNMSRDGTADLGVRGVVEARHGRALGRDDQRLAVRVSGLQCALAQRLEKETINR